MPTILQAAFGGIFTHFISDSTIPIVIAFIPLFIVYCCDDAACLWKVEKVTALQGPGLCNWLFGPPLSVIPLFSNDDEMYVDDVDDDY